MKRHRWTADEDTLLRAAYPDTPTAELASTLGLSVQQVYDKAQALGLRKSAAYLAGPHASRLRRGDAVGADHRFQPGHEPWNKGTHFVAPGRSVETRFKAGNRTGKAAQNWQPVGAERLTKDGILQRKVSDTGYTPRDYVAVHKLVWEAANGPVPPGHIVVFCNGDRRDIRLDNLECISMAENMRRNTLHRYPPDIVKAMQLRGALNRKINARSKR